MTRVYVGGTFDLPHPGHVRLLQRAAKLGDVWVALNTDDFAARYKRRPILTLEERREVISELRCVARVIVNTGDEDSRVAILRTRPGVIVHGDDWTGDSYLAQLGVTREWLDAQGIKLVYLPYTEGISTGDIIERVRS